MCDISTVRTRPISIIRNEEKRGAREVLSLSSSPLSIIVLGFSEHISSAIDSERVYIGSPPVKLRLIIWEVYQAAYPHDRGVYTSSL